MWNEALHSYIKLLWHLPIWYIYLGTDQRYDQSYWLASMEWTAFNHLTLTCVYNICSHLRAGTEAKKCVIYMCVYSIYSSYVRMIAVWNNSYYFLVISYSCPGVLYLGSLSLQDTHCLIQESFALVNSSQSEGQATAILEAQALETVVIVRNIPSNLDIVKHGHTGLVYSTPEVQAKL